MARDFNQTRFTTAKLVAGANIDKMGYTFAVEDPWKADGFTSVNISVEQVPNNIKNYLEGDTSITIYGVPINVDKLCKGALESFPNIQYLYLFSLTMVDIAEETENQEDYLSYLSNLDTVYVPQDLLTSYRNRYPNLTFDEIRVDYEYTIEQPSGTVDILTSQIVTDDLSSLSSQDKNAITKLIISSDFLYNVDNVVWSYNFATYLPNLNNNIWYNGNKYDFTTRTLTGVDELLESDITNFIATIGNDKRSGVLELHFEGFSDMSVALEYNYEDLPNLEYLWLDNVRYKFVKISGYRTIEYVEGNGTQYSTLNANFTENAEIELDIKHNINSSKKYIVRGDNLSLAIWSASNNSSGDIYAIAWGNIFNYGSAVRINKNTRYLIKATKTNIKANGSVIYTMNSSQQSVTYSASSISPFGTVAEQYGSGKYYSLKITENNMVLLNAVPMLNLSTNKAGFYDLESDTFYGNLGSGDYAYGQQINRFYNHTYFYPITDLVSEYDSTKEQTFYLDYNGTLPSYPNYQLTYYTDINCTTSILPENMQSGTRYYVKAVMVTLVIQGSGTLTSAIVNQQVEKSR